MRTRNQTKRQPEPAGEEDTKKPRRDSGSHLKSVDDNGTLTDISQEAVGKLLKRVNLRGSRGLKKQDSYLHKCDSIDKLETGSKENEIQNSSPTKEKAEGGSSKHANPHGDDEMDEPDWEDGSVPTQSSTKDHQEDKVNSVTIEFEASPDSAKRKPICRASAEDKELAELVHKVHLLCLLGRGRLIDQACNDPLIQAALLSLIPTQFLKISEVSKLTATALAPLVNWFHNNFRVTSPGGTERSFQSALALALEMHEGTAEEVAALSVVLFRALNLTTRFVAILDVSSLKPDVDKSESVSKHAKGVRRGIFNSSTLMVAPPDLVSGSHDKQSANDAKNNVCETSLRVSCKNKVNKTTSSISQRKHSAAAGQSTDKMLVNDSIVLNLSNDKMLDSQACEAHNNTSDVCFTKQSKGPKRKGDLEFEMQLEMAIAATTSENSKSNTDSDVTNFHCNSKNLSLKGMKRVRSEELPSSSQGISVAVGSRKVGAPLYWAEVYCSGENLTGKWVHVDAVNAIVDGEEKVEAAVAACKTSLRYAIAFAGHGAKDVTRRYCMKWYKIASQRINSSWWDAVLAPLKELESGAIGDMVFLRQEGSQEHEKTEAARMPVQSTFVCVSDPLNSSAKLTTEVLRVNSQKFTAASSAKNSFVASRNSLEDMELETRALTEPLPTNQQAYKNHQLYALERWLTKYQILHPKGPVLGFCSGRPVYPRTCVQILHTKERWLRDGMQIKASELPAKYLKRSLQQSNTQACEEDDYDEGDCGQNTALYGRWQTEPLQLPHAVNGIVPRNERGQVDVWSEKCLPPGTVHLKLPRVVPIAKRLEIDFAPAMVGFEFRNGRSFPVFEGIVVCAEFKDAILEAYAEEEERREAEEKRRNEVQAINRWYQLLSSIVVRQRLNNCYGDGSSSHASNDNQKTNGEDKRQTSKCQQPRNLHDSKQDAPPLEPTRDHEHVFLTDDQTIDEESSTRTKRCGCGFSVEVEEL